MKVNEFNIRHWTILLYEISYGWISTRHAL